MPVWETDWKFEMHKSAKQELCPNLQFRGDLIGLTAETLSRDYTNLLMSRCIQYLLWRSSQRWTRLVDRTLLSWSNFSWSLWPFRNCLGIETTNLIGQITDIQGTCDPWCYYVLRPQVWKPLAFLGGFPGGSGGKESGRPGWKNAETWVWSLG